MPSALEDDLVSGGDEKRNYDGPATLEGTLEVRKPLGIRIHKSTLRVTNIEPNAAVQGDVFIGDKIVALDGKAVPDTTDLYRRLKEPSPIVRVRMEHGTFSWCKYVGTTIEMLHLDKDVVKATGRAIDVIKVCLSFRFLLEMEESKEEQEDVLQMSVRYDARERVQIASCESGGLAAIHLRPGDIIRDVNDHPVSSKEMLQYYICEGIKENNGQVRLMVERAAGGDDAFRDQIEMSADVLSIAQKQIVMFKQTTSKQKPKSVLKRTKSKQSVRVSSDAPETHEIQSDHDPATLKSCKSANK